MLDVVYFVQSGSMYQGALPNERDLSITRNADVSRELVTVPLWGITNGDRTNKIG